MANGAIIITWGNPVRGREMQSLDVFGRALAYWDEQAKEGRIHGHHEYFALTGNATQRQGTMVVEGDLDQLVQLMVDEQNMRLLAEAGQIVENFDTSLCEQNSDDAINRYVNVLNDMGLS
ncbi:MAG: hypothetical protein JO075_13875 [Acidimicrobiia bacterium]|nr:hypothetical protein [Acidimicrobiia bacterium]MBV8304803.1 hypothetical protein [Acidimicrobiia bacterium]